MNALQKWFGFFCRIVINSLQRPSNSSLHLEVERSNVSFDNLYILYNEIGSFQLLCRIIERL